MIKAKKSPSKNDSWLSERQRAEDIILGGLGFGEDVTILEIKNSTFGFKGKAMYRDGSRIDIRNDDQLSELEIWALTILSS